MRDWDEFHFTRWNRIKNTPSPPSDLKSSKIRFILINLNLQWNIINFSTARSNTQHFLISIPPTLGMVIIELDSDCARCYILLEKSININFLISLPPLSRHRRLIDYIEQYNIESHHHRRSRQKKHPTCGVSFSRETYYSNRECSNTHYELK